MKFVSSSFRMIMRTAFHFALSHIFPPLSLCVMWVFTIYFHRSYKLAHLIVTSVKCEIEWIKCAHQWHKVVQQISRHISRIQMPGRKKEKRRELVRSTRVMLSEMRDAKLSATDASQVALSHAIEMKLKRKSSCLGDRERERRKVSSRQRTIRKWRTRKKREETMNKCVMW